jgi:FkbM family methyltransferase
MSPKIFKRILRKALERLDIPTVNYYALRAAIKSRREPLRALIELKKRLSGRPNVSRDTRFLHRIADRRIAEALQHFDFSSSQIGQDFFVLCELDFMQNGFFVEFGAADGLRFSNTYLLEKKYGWRGILAEPAKCWHGDLSIRRNSHIETRCVWGSSGEKLVFNQTSTAEFSTIDTFSSEDWAKEIRKNGIQYEVETISLVDLLKKYNAPRLVDYLSIDTEGSEFEILKHFNFDDYQFRVITCEHNNTPARAKINDLLSSYGYVRKFEDLSQFDDWYVKRTV